MTTFVVIPCLNEELSLYSTCQSLGFGRAENQPEDRVLILVDNGSTDRTREVMTSVARRSEAGSTVLASEATRGYAPPRRRGAHLARDLAVERKYPVDASLIVQADADTVYQPDYTEKLRFAAERVRNTLVHGRTVIPPDFISNHVRYENLCEDAHTVVRPLCVAENEQVIVDDKVCAYWLSDYLAWGGHTQEFDNEGHEVHAETSRMFIRAKALGARLAHVDGALAVPSRRKVISGPALYYITDGFPRGPHWIAKWRDAYGCDTFDRFYQDRIGLRNATAVRWAHEVTLFGALPCAVARALEAPIASHDRLLDPLIDLLPPPTANDLLRAPGKILAGALDIVDAKALEISSFIAGMIDLSEMKD